MSLINHPAGDHGFEIRNDTAEARRELRWDASSHPISYTDADTSKS